MPRQYTLYTKSIGDSPDVWVILKTAEGEQQLMSEVLKLVDNSDPKLSVSWVRTA